MQRKATHSTQNWDAKHVWGEPDGVRQHLFKIVFLEIENKKSAVCVLAPHGL